MFCKPSHRRTKLVGIREPRLVFLGLIEFSPLFQFLAERQCIVAKFFVEGKIWLPNEEEMSAELAQDLSEYPLEKRHKFFHLKPMSEDWDYFYKLASLVLMEIGREFFDKLCFVLEELTKSTILELRLGQGVDYSPFFPDFKGDSSEFF